MPKIEIDIEDFDHLRGEKQRLEQIIEEKDGQIYALRQQLDKKDYQEKAVVLADRLTSEYLKAIFKSLGFDQEHWQTIDFSHEIKYKRDSDLWYTYPDLKVELNASVCESFRDAFLRIGVIPKSKEEKEIDDPLDLDKV